VVAMSTATLDSLLNATSPSRYSYGWYAGKAETVITASVVLAVLLAEVTGLYRRLSDMAMVDTLTHLFNRRALEAHMQLVIRHAKRHSSGLGLLMVDVDFFKGYNDAYGHAAGDECLRRVAAVLKAAAPRPLDHVSRYGGEEFVVLLPETPREGAVAVARRILGRIEDAAIPYARYGRGHITVSVGVGFVADARDVDEVALFSCADLALYEAKDRGRNAFVIADYTSTPVRVEPLPYAETQSLSRT
ncbi:MAG: GGDEF domain-containing protein, partial [Candidatus Eremiobacteraeota bacterium]|nr:GGDEF domain-containing protein [Candidatus Eremiobacteraeota bacterium]